MYGDGTPIHISIINQAKTPIGYDLPTVAAALQMQANEHFCPLWGLQPITVTVDTIAPYDAWSLDLYDDADQAGELGDHEDTPTDLPVGRVFVATTISDGEIVPVTMSHELLEMLGDPDIDLCVQIENELYAYEVCDAVEEQTYLINGIPVSNFVTPAWFRPSSPAGSKFDHLGLVTAPLQLLKGGYISVARISPRWTQKMGAERKAKKHQYRHNHRKRHSAHQA